MKKLSLRMLFKRMCMKSPSFFERVAKIGLAIAGACIATKAYLGLANVNIDIVNTWLNYGIVGGGVSTFISTLTVENPEDLHKPKDEIDNAA